MNEEIRVHLSTRLAHCFTEIDRLHLEVKTLNDLLRRGNLANIDTIPPVIQLSPPRRQPGEGGEVRPLTPRPRLVPTKSTPNIREWPGATDAQHPALRPSASVISQSRYPRFPRVRIKAECLRFPFSSHASHSS